MHSAILIGIKHTLASNSSTSTSKSFHRSPEPLASRSSWERVMVEARREYAVSLLSNNDSSVRHCLCSESYVDMNGMMRVGDALRRAPTVRSCGLRHACKPLLTKRDDQTRNWQGGTRFPTYPLTFFFDTRTLTIRTYLMISARSLLHYSTQ